MLIFVVNKNLLNIQGQPDSENQKNAGEACFAGICY